MGTKHPYIYIKYGVGTMHLYIKYGVWGQGGTNHSYIKYGVGRVAQNIHTYNIALCRQGTLKQGQECVNFLDYGENNHFGLMWYHGNLIHQLGDHK